MKPITILSCILFFALTGCAVYPTYDNVAYATPTYSAGVAYGYAPAPVYAPPPVYVRPAPYYGGIYYHRGYYGGHRHGGHWH
jgi:hypothetical protein